MHWVIFEQLIKVIEAIDKLEAEEMNDEYSVSKRVSHTCGNMPDDRMESIETANNKPNTEGCLITQQIGEKNESIVQSYPIKLSHNEGNLIVTWDTAPNGYQVALYQDNQEISSNHFNNPPAIFPTASLEAGTYSIEVKVKNNHLSNGSSRSNFQSLLPSIVKLKAPTPISLTYNNATQKLNVSWPPVLDAKFYLVQLVNIEDNDQVFFQKKIPKEQTYLDINVSSLQGKAGTYQAWIQAKGDAEYIDSDISRSDSNLSFFHQSINKEKILKLFKQKAIFLAALALIPLGWLLIQNLNQPESSISGRVIRVNPVTGNDSADGSKATPFRTIAHALQQAHSGEKILLEAGNYRETFPLVVPSGIIIIIKPSAKFVIFNDIEDHWASEVIQKLAVNGIISGFPDGSFRPNAKMTRAEYAALLVKAFNPKQKRLGKNFLDVSLDFWAYKPIQQVYRSEFLTGFPNNTFLPNKDLQRVEIMVSLVSGMGLTQGDETVLNFYNDRNSIPNWAKQKTAIATATQLVKGYDDKQLKPLKSATRAEVAVIVYQALIKTKKLTATHPTTFFLTQTIGGK